MEANDILKFSSGPLRKKLIESYVLGELNLSIRAPTVLEIGAGTCQASYMIKNTYKQRSFVVSTDISSVALSTGKKLASTYAERVDDYVCCDATKLPFRDQSFQLIFGGAVLHHIKNPVNACIEIKRVLVSEGEYFGLEGTVHAILRIFVRMLSGAQYRISKENVREDMYDVSSWLRMFHEAHMKVDIYPIIAPSIYRELIGVQVTPRSYRPRYNIRYPYERLLSVLPKHFAMVLIRTILPGSVLIRARSETTSRTSNLDVPSTL
jgi:ubiquinone/menaquinone biosynthesis C-methylase UbiE